VENECISHKPILCAIRVPKIIKVGGNLTKLWQKQFFETWCTWKQYHGLKQDQELETVIKIQEQDQLYF